MDRELPTFARTYPWCSPSEFRKLTLRDWQLLRAPLIEEAKEARAMQAKQLHANARRSK